LRQGLQRRHDRRVARRAKRPDRADPRFAVGRRERAGQLGDRLGRQRRIEASDGQREVLADARVVVFGGDKRLHELRRKRAIGADLRVAHQPRELVRRGPAPIGAAVADLGEIVLRFAIVGEQRAEADVDRDRDGDHGQRNQKELDGQSRSGDEWVASRGFALDEFFHE
jgi:hypothetical protein